MPALSQTRAYAALLLIVILWGTFPTTAKVALRDLSPFLICTFRAAIASAFLALSVARSGAATPRPLTAATLRSLFVLGFLGLVMSTQVTYLGIATTTAANAALLQAASPVIVALGARVVLGERLRRPQWLGIAISTFGVLLVVTDGRLAALRPADLRLGDFLTLVAQVGWMGYTVYGTRVLADLSPTLATAGAYVCGTLLLLPIAALSIPFFPVPRLASPLAWAVVVYQALPGAIAHVWWYRAVERVGATRAAIFQNVTPVVGLLLATTLLREPVDRWLVVGGGLVLAGVGLTTRGQERRGRA